MNAFRLLPAALCCAFAVLAAPAQQTAPVQVMIVGFAHLSQLNSGQAPVDVLQPVHQRSLAHVREVLGTFQVDAVMVEMEPKEQAELTAKYKAFCGPEHVVPKGEERDEIVQVAFPLACRQSLGEVTAINFYDSTPQAMLASGENIARYQGELGQLQGFARPLSKQLADGSVSLYDFIRTINAPDKIELSHRLLFNTPAYVRDGDFHDPPVNVDMQRVDKHYIGVEFIELFYNRNLRIYSNILQAQQRLGSKRILIMLGQNHVGVLQELLRHNPNFQVVESASYLK
ncbi:MAG: DUF5694 domain-containing protein [Janthinobacterium lividum]